VRQCKNREKKVLFRRRKGTRLCLPKKCATRGRRKALGVVCVCVCLCVQLLTVSSCRLSVQRPPGKMGGGKERHTPRNALLPDALRRLNAGRHFSQRRSSYRWITLPTLLPLYSQPLPHTIHRRFGVISRKAKSFQCF
jgi:hypothetical protein